MLTITIPERETWSEEKNMFIVIPKQKLQLEHSLLSVSKWESKWHVPFLNDNKRTKVEKTQEMVIDYIRCMTITKDVDPMVYYNMTSENVEQIQAYINDPMTATTFVERPDGKKYQNSGNFTTAEILYYEMFELGIPLEFEKRHLNKLLAQIRVCGEKREQQNNPKKMSKAEWAKQQHALHAARRRTHAPRK